jgi:hypothetical protein
MQISPFWRIVPLLIIAHAVQTTWLSGPMWGWVRPDLPFLIALAAGLLGVRRSGRSRHRGGTFDWSGRARGTSDRSGVACPSPALLGALGALFGVSSRRAAAVRLRRDVVVRRIFMLMSPPNFRFRGGDATRSQARRRTRSDVAGFFSWRDWSLRAARTFLFKRDLKHNSRLGRASDSVFAPPHHVSLSSRPDPRMGLSRHAPQLKRLMGLL